MAYIRWFEHTGLEDVASVGGKNASLGEMIRELSALGVAVPGGFAVTAEGYRRFLGENALEANIKEILSGLDRRDVAGLTRRAKHIRSLILQGQWPEDLRRELLAAQRELAERTGQADAYLAVRSSATAEDLPHASFAGQQESFLMVQGPQALLDSVRRAFASLFTARAVSYREDMGFDHLSIALSVGVQRMIRSDLAASGVVFTLEPETGHDNILYLSSAWGLGENIVQGRVKPDAFYIHKAKLAEGYKPVVWKKLGGKELRLVYDELEHRLDNRATDEAERAAFSLSDEEALQLARWALAIEKHYSRKHGRATPMDIEWAKDGPSGELYIVQARPETVHSQKRGYTLKLYELKERGPVLVEGLAVGEAVGVGPANLIDAPDQMGRFMAGNVLVTTMTDPDWEPIMKRAAAIVTERGGRTSHAAIVARELGIPAVVGAEGAMERIRSGETVTLSTVEGEVGRVYRGKLEFNVNEVDLLHLERPQTDIMLNLGNPEQAFSAAQLPTQGIGLARMEFIFTSWLRVHPLALTRFETLPPELKRQVGALTAGYADKTEYFVDTLAQGIGTLAAAFWPREVLLRFSDFKTNEYAHLLGGELFEPPEENPMLGWRGASRYYHPDYKEGFLLEVAAVKRVRDVYGLKNLKVMVPFCRSPEEGRKVLEVMAEGGLSRGRDGLEVYVMAELPSNVFEARAFAEVFDGFSIGSNDLTQLVLGVDRDAERIAPLFDERSESVKRACTWLIRDAHRAGRKIGICGQAPSDYPEFAAFLVQEGIDSLSLNPDAILRTSQGILEAERALKLEGSF